MTKTMKERTGIITRIDTLKSSRNAGESYIRVCFDILQPDGSTTWAKTDLVPKFRNYARWKNFLKVGTKLKGLYLKRSDTVDADSMISLA